MRNEMLRVTLPPRLHNFMVSQFAAEMIVAHRNAIRRPYKGGRWHQVDRAVRAMFNTWLKKKNGGYYRSAYFGGRTWGEHGSSCQPESLTTKKSG